MRWCCLPILSLMSACGSGGVIFVPTPPEDSEARTVVIVLEFEDAIAAKIYRQPLADPDFLSLAERFVGTPRAYALYYERTPETLEFQLGELLAVEQGSLPCERGLPYKTLSTQADVDEEWLAAAAPKRVLAHLGGTGACRPTNICKTWRSTSLPLATGQNVHIILPLGDGSVLTTGLDSVFQQASADVVVRRPEYDGLPAIVAHRDERGRLWFGGHLGLTANGPLEGPFVEEQLATDISIGAIVPSPSGDRVLAIASQDADGDRRVEIYLREGGQWELIHRRTPIDASTTQSDIFWLDDRTAIMNYGGRVALRVDDRLATEVPVPGGFKSMDYSPEGGPVGRRPKRRALPLRSTVSRV